MLFRGWTAGLTSLISLVLVSMGRYESEYSQGGQRKTEQGGTELPRTFQIGIQVLDLIGLYRANIVCPNTQCVVCPPYLALFRRNYGMWEIYASTKWTKNNWTFCIQYGLEYYTATPPYYSGQAGRIENNTFYSQLSLSRLSRESAQRYWIYWYH